MTGPSLGILKVPRGRISRKNRLVTTRQKPIIASYASAFESIAAQLEKLDVVWVSVGNGGWPTHDRHDGKHVAPSWPAQTPFLPVSLSSVPPVVIIRLRQRVFVGWLAALSPP